MNFFLVSSIYDVVISLYNVQLYTHCPCLPLLPCSLLPVEELAQQVQKATESLERCMEIANRINSELPERERLEHFRIHTTSRTDRETPDR